MRCLSEGFNSLKKRNTIRKVFAISLLLISSISITPKIFFHDVIAHHRDVVSSCDHPRESKACLHQTGFNCHAEDLVVTAPYLIFPDVYFSIVNTVFGDTSTFYYSSSPQECLIHKESRGPPKV